MAVPTQAGVAARRHRAADRESQRWGAHWDAGEQVAEALGGDRQLLPQIESVEGLFAMPELLAREDVARLIFGHLDFALDLGSGRDQQAMLYTRSQIVLHSRFAGKAPPVDSVTPDFRNEAACRLDAAVYTEI